jgi:selenoprotein W-related protein
MLANFWPYISELTLIPSDGGRFEVTVDDTLIYSKLKTGRHAQSGEVLGLFQEHTGLEPIPQE